MDFDHLGEVWRGQSGKDFRAQPQDLLARIRAQGLELAQLVRRRDRVETWGALLVLPIFVWVSVAGRFDVSRVGAAILAGACLLIPLRLRRSRRPPPDPALPLAETLTQELDRIRAQQRLLRTVLWWYLAPLGIGVVLFLAGPLGSPSLIAGAALSVAGLYGWLYHLNQQTVRNELEPRARELEEWIASLRQGE